MLPIVLKYYILIVCSIFTYTKILKLNPTKKIKVQILAYCLVLSFLVYYLRIYARSSSLFIMVIAFAFIFGKSLNISNSTSITTSVISFGISYAIFLLSIPFVAMVIYVISLFVKRFPSDFFSYICIGFFQFLFIWILFRIKRLRNGMPFLQKENINDIGVHLSILILVTLSLLTMSDTPQLMYSIPLFISVLSGIILIHWWKDRLSQNYIITIKNREIDELHEKMRTQEVMLNQLQHENDHLSSIIHKDNKLIPSMELSVKEFLDSSIEELNPLKIQAAGKKIQKQLSQITLERNGSLKDYEHTNKKLPHTNLPSLDTLLQYMFYKANSENIYFDLVIKENTDFINNLDISESELRTVLADLIDNAIIATKNCVTKKILVNISSSSHIHIDIFDSGILFEADTLLHMGITRTSTHLSEGGSGIGLMTVFGILKKYGASFIIEEFDSTEIYTKKISIHFDSLHELKLRTNRSDLPSLLSKRTDIIFF